MRFAVALDLSVTFRAHGAPRGNSITWRAGRVIAGVAGIGDPSSGAVAKEGSRRLPRGVWDQVQRFKEPGSD